jgi:hypothetical protein
MWGGVYKITVSLVKNREELRRRILSSKIQLFDVIDLIHVKVRKKRVTIEI